VADEECTEAMKAQRLQMDGSQTQLPVLGTMAVAVETVWAVVEVGTVDAAAIEMLHLIEAFETDQKMLAVD
jgi:hypothetical protein